MLTKVKVCKMKQRQVVLSLVVAQQKEELMGTRAGKGKGLTTFYDSYRRFAI